MSTIEMEAKVERKAEEKEEEEEEEETLVLVELHGVIDSEIFTQDTFGKFKVLALDSDRPVLQVENFIFSGEYEHTLGTAVLFEEEEKRLKCDPVFCKKPPRMLRYACSTTRKLSMKRVFVSEKSAGEEEGVPGSSQAPQDSSDVGGAGSVEDSATDDMLTEPSQAEHQE